MTGQPALSFEERCDWLRLARTAGVGPITFHRLLRAYATPARALRALPSLGPKTWAIPSRQTAAAEIAAIEDMGGSILCAGEPDYPEALASIQAPPPIISCAGDLSLLKRPCLAIVGARTASAAGLRLAEILARDAAEAGFTIVSGLARGVDAAVHRASVHAGACAVLAGGLKKPYPPQNEALYQDILSRGCAVSETPIEWVATARDFPRRNRIIAGLSLGVLVVEAAARSGSQITARAALELGREVLACPGSPLDPRTKGSNDLLRQGATLVESLDDILRVIAPQAPPPSRPAEVFEAVDHAYEADSALTARVAALLSPTPVHLDVLARAAKASPAQCAAALVELELAGRASSLAGGYAIGGLNEPG